MASLAELQRSMSVALLKPDFDCELLAEIAAGPIAPEKSLRIHRNTIFGALVNALRLSHPTVAALVGEECFEQTALRYSRSQPPTAAHLMFYGDSFPEYLAQDPATLSLLYLPDVARFDRLLERTVMTGASRPCSYLLEGGLQLRFEPSLSMLEARYAVDQIRSAVHALNQDVLADVDLSAHQRWFAVWEQEGEAACVMVSAPSARFVSALLEGASTEVALNRAALDGDPESALGAIDHEVLRGRFARIGSREPFGDAGES